MRLLLLLIDQIIPELKDLFSTWIGTVVPRTVLDVELKLAENP